MKPLLDMFSGYLGVLSICQKKYRIFFFFNSPKPLYAES